MTKNSIRKHRLPSPQEVAELKKIHNKAKFSTTEKKNAIVGTIPTATSLVLVAAGPLAASIVTIYTMIIYLAEQDLRIIFRESLELAQILFRFGTEVILQIGNEAMAQSYTNVQLTSFLYILESIIYMIPYVKNNMIDLINASYTSNLNRELLGETIERMIELERLTRSCYRVIEGHLNIMIQNSNVIPLPYEEVYSDWLHYLSTTGLV